jgi:LPXTG-motif cell wall-anchored protein
MRTLLRSACLATAAATVLLAAPAAHAAPGDNGTVKIHDAKTGEALMKNQPHVCTFYLDAFKFDAGQQATWTIVEWPPTGTQGKVVLKADKTLDAQGHGRTEDLQLPDGHYKLNWHFVGEHGKGGKHKVFWVDCKDEGGTTGTTPSQGASTTPTDQASQPASPAPSSTSSSAAAAPSAAPSPNGGSSDLAETGSSAPIGALSGAAALLVGAGAYLTLRRRNARSRQH